MGLDPLSIGLMIAGTAISGIGAISAQSAQERQLRAKQRIADVEAQNQRLEQVRQARIARARIVQAGENQGAGGSSAVVGGAEGVVNQQESNIQYIDNQQDINHAIISAQKSQVNAQGLETLGSGVTDLGGTIFKNAPYIQSKVDSIFG